MWSFIDKILYLLMQLSNPMNKTAVEKYNKILFNSIQYKIIAKFITSNHANYEFYLYSIIPIKQTRIKNKKLRK